MQVQVSHRSPSNPVLHRHLPLLQMPLIQPLPQYCLRVSIRVISCCIKLVFTELFWTSSGFLLNFIGKYWSIRVLPLTVRNITVLPGYIRVRCVAPGSTLVLWTWVGISTVIPVQSCMRKVLRCSSVLVGKLEGPGLANAPADRFRFSTEVRGLTLNHAVTVTRR